MIPGLGGVNPKQLQGMMAKMGIKQEPVDAKRVIIEKEDGRIVIDNPSVMKTEMHGQVSWQVQGDANEEQEGFSDEDIEMIMDKTGKGKDEVKSVLEETGDIAEAILKLSE